MASRGTKYLSVTAFNRGLVLNRPPLALEDGEATVAENVDLENNTLKRREGWTPIHAATLPSGDSSPIIALFPFYEEGESPELFAVSQSGQAMNSNGEDFVSLGTLASAELQHASLLAAEDKVYIAWKANNAGAKMKVWNGSTLSEVSGSPNVWLLSTYGDSIWAAGAGSTESRLYWSKFFPNQETWPATNFVDITPGDGDKITGMARMLNAFIIFKERSIHRITGQQPEDASISSGDLTVTSYQEQEGCVAPGSLVATNNLIIYLNRKGIFGYDGVQPQELTEPIRPLFEELNEGQIENARGAWVEIGHYLLSLASADSQVPDTVISLRLFPERTITVWKGLQAYAISTFRFDGTTKTVFGFPGAVGKQTGNTDNGDLIEWEYTTGILDMGDEPFDNVIRRAWVWTKPVGGTLEVELLPNFMEQGSRQSVELSGGFTKSESLVRKRTGAFGRGRHWQLRLGGKSNSPVPEVSEVQIEYFPQNRL